MSKKCAERLTDLEVQVMKVLWDSERAMTNSEIAEELKAVSYTHLAGYRERP